MAPTYQNGDVLVLEKDPQVRVDEIAVFDLPKAWRSLHYGSDRDSFVKRIVGVPGDTIEWDGKTWTIGDRTFPYENKTERCHSESFTGEVKKGSVFVVGDTEELSIDSRLAFCRNVDFLVPIDLITKKGDVVRLLAS